MARFKHVSLPAATYRFNNRRVPVSKELIKEYVDNTNAMLAAGIRVPMLKKHRSGDDPQGGPVVVPAGKKVVPNEDTVGWLHKLYVENGALGIEMDVKDADYHKQLKDGTIRFTSPQLSTKSYTDGMGREWGKVVRHVAFTPEPRNPNQEPIVEMSFSELSDEYVTLSFADLDEPEKKKEKEKEVVSDGKTPDGFPADDKEPPLDGQNPAIEPAQEEMPTPEPDPVGDQMTAITENLAQLTSLFAALNIEPPKADFGIDPVQWTTELCDSLRQVNLVAGVHPKDTLREESGVYQFSELDEHPDPLVRSMYKRMKEYDDANRVQRETIARKNLDDMISGSGIPVPAREAIAGKIGALSFSDADGELSEAPLFTATEVIKIVADSIPKFLNFSELDVTSASDAKHPDNEAFFRKPTKPGQPAVVDRDEAAKIVDDLEARFYRAPTDNGVKK